MSSEDIIQTALHIVNIIYSVFGTIIAATGIWFFVELSELISLRNSNHYLLDYRVYWPQVVPWLFILYGVFVMLTAVCGWCGANKESRGLLGIHGVFLLFIVIGQLIAATLIFVYVDGEATDNFITDTVYDGYHNTESNTEALEAFGRFERKLRCCGANGARDYKSWRNDLPLSCCLDSQSICEFTDKEANERLGCAKVASVYTKIISSSVAGASLLFSLVEIVGLVLAWRLFDSLKEVEHYIQDEMAGETEC
ncbi:tetraspanin-9-like [Manduca sexta]|uniref:tetraspanin-9-like n=1 Tax=Manduca sexta TaxID=7130 RepID=UPI00188E4BC5|nr:tetraspanin-9-like [Manduca sexta]